MEVDGNIASVSYKIILQEKAIIMCFNSKQSGFSVFAPPFPKVKTGAASLIF